ncbi:Mediator of RNA polymerase II transcription subunit 15a [Linum perenne]
MDGRNWNAAAAPGGEEAAVDGADWRASLKAGSRARVVNKIVEILTRHLPFHGRDGFEQLRKIAARYEQKVHTAATSQNDYVRRISLKMFTVENRSQSSMPSSFVYLPPKSPGNPGGQDDDEGFETGWLAELGFRV